MREIWILLALQLIIKVSCMYVRSEVKFDIVQLNYAESGDYFLYGNCGGHKITPRSRLLPVCGSYNNDKISIIIATFIFSSRVSTEMVFEVVTNYSRFTPLLSGIVDKLKYACEDVIEFIYSYNSSICSSDTDSCSDSCPDCQLNSVTYLHSINCTNEVFLFVRTTCANFSIPGACIGLNSPQSSCCLKTPNQDSVTLPSILAPLCILFLITLIAAIALTAYSVKTRNSKSKKSATEIIPNPCYYTTEFSQDLSKAIEKWKAVFSECSHSSRTLVIGKKLGEGFFGVVHEGEMLLGTCGTARKIAVKSMKVCLLNQLEDFLSEAATMLKFDHPNILKLEGVCFDTENGLPVIVLPLMVNRDLKSFLVSKRNNVTADEFTFPPGLSLTTIISMCLDLAYGMEYLSEQKFVHRDLAARNCMVNDKLSVKIGDFGLSRDIHYKDYQLMHAHTAKVPVKWLAVESLLDHIFNEKTDVWSFGVVCWEVFSLGTQPYCTIENCDIPDFLNSGQRLKKPNLCPEDIYQKTVLKCWSALPDDRPSFSECVLLLQKHLSEAVEI